MAAVLAVVASAAFYGVYRVFFLCSDEIVLNGNVEIQDVDVSFRVSGRISEIMVDEGNEVQKGSVLASLDSDVYEIKVRTAKAHMEEAETSLVNARKNHIRMVDLFKKKSISEKIYDNAKTEYEIAKAKRDSASAAYDLAAVELKDTKLISPVDGVILTRNVECGEMINASVPAFTIMPKTVTKIKTFAGEDVLSRIKYGDAVYVNNETDSGTKYKGHIGFISSEAEFTPKNIETKELRASLMYRIRVILDEPAPSLKQGMPVTISCRK
ncbi:MAG: efflux RND transporter periplasmic adaptor subunit [Holosporales bacterium]|nr:efflux RND transporter periplasmic adaptor subunit [Holosporales bacterium]